MGAQPGGGAGGTKIQPFQVTAKQDGTSTINMQSISAMPAYEAKSFEELRFEDYSQGNRGSQNAAAPAPGGFGFGSTLGGQAPAPTTGFGFGGTSTTTPGTSPFGGSTLGGAPAPSTGFGGFGAPSSTPAPGGAFSSAAPSTSLFGGGSTTQTGSLFGAPAPGQSSSLFGQTPAPTTGFGGSGFGATSNTTR